MDRNSITQLPYSAIKYMIDHVFLPPELPQEDDSDSKYDTFMVNTILCALRKFKEYNQYDTNTMIESVIEMITSMKAISDTSNTIGTVNEGGLLDALVALPRLGGTILLNIRAQNAGVIISKVDGSVRVEAFELSPLNKSIFAARGRLRRSFPGIALDIPITTFDQPNFLATLAHTLAKMSHQAVAGTKPKVRKAGTMHDEDRDSTHPKIVTELLMGFLMPMGAVVNVKPIWKNTREEVMWCNARLPWRRSPVWLLLRVSMQLAFARSPVSERESAEPYKAFMAFLMSQVLELSFSHNVSCDMLYVMNAKLGRRLLKLKPAVAWAGLPIIHSIMNRTTEIISTKWGNFQAQAISHPDLPILKTLDFDRDTFFSLHTFGEFVTSLSINSVNVSKTFIQPTSGFIKYQAESLPTSVCVQEGYTMHNIKAFETWVAFHLPQWLEQNKGSATNCESLGTSMANYFRAASSLYSGDPENLSTMLLTVIELWIAFDQSSMRLCGLLKDYDPGIPIELLQALILPTRSQMERLLCAEAYLQARRGCAEYVSPSIFQDYGRPGCFGVRYFNQSSKHQQLRFDIEQNAIRDRNEKVAELNRKKETYKSLMILYDQSDCEFIEVITDPYNDFREQQHSRTCRRCSYKSQAASIEIQVHEWPLPDKDLEAKSTVFELHVPPFFAYWRDAALFLLLEVFQTEPRSALRPRAYHPLSTYSGLSSYFVPAIPGQRIILLSEVKPHVVTHRQTKSISDTTQSDVCVKNGLRYQYYDNVMGSFIDCFEVTAAITELLLYRLPTQSSSLQKFLVRSYMNPNGLSPNTVIATQCHCPEHMSLDEYKALCNIPLGHKIQWHNILLQLAAPVVDFKKAETVLVILQSIYQAGPSTDAKVLRASHKVVGDQRFAENLVKSLDESLQRVRENWESSQALSIFISLSARLLSLSTSESIKMLCLSYLSKTRAVTFGWVNLLTKKASTATCDPHRATLYVQAVELALICADSFNVDDMHINDVLDSAEAGSIYIQCCILIQEGSSVISGSSNLMTPILFRRWQALCYRCYPILARRILMGKTQSLDDAMEKSWSHYVAGPGWRAVSDELDYWMFNTISPRGSIKMVTVHYNLLTGEVLVNGLPLGHLPPRYRKHLIYPVLFGQLNLEVMPATLPSMQFSGKRSHAGHIVHLGIRAIPGIDDSSQFDLLVRAERHGRTCNLIPPRVFYGEFPAYFTEAFVHWYDADSDSVEFRPIEDPWTSSPDNWKLVREPDLKQWRLIKDDLAMVNVRSKTAKAISNILSPLEVPLRIHTVLQCSSSTLDIELPRVSLAFYLKSGMSLLHSRQFRGFAIDSDQSLGTLIGFMNKLVLRNDANVERLVVLLEGLTLCERNGDHVHITVNHDSVRRAHAFPIDHRLERILDNGTLQSKLWLCYLHALTSFCLPDPLIKRTGTEQALSILKSAAVRSFDRLAQESVDLLHEIARLTAKRNYYPANERVMQTVAWTPQLSFLAQDNGYYENVSSIFDQAKRARLFYPTYDIKLLALDCMETDLMVRDRIRSSIFRISGFGAEDHTTKYDVTYQARDRSQNSEQGFQVYYISSFVFHERQTCSYPVSDQWATSAWSFFEKEIRVLGPVHPLPDSELKYDARALQSWSEDVFTNWCVLHRELSCVYPRFDKFRLMIWLATLAFVKGCDMGIVQALGSFFVIAQFAHISPPRIASFQPSEGITVRTQELRTALRSALRSFAHCPESRLSRRSGEFQRAFSQRQQSQFQSHQDRTINRLIQELQDQWPCEIPALPDFEELRTYIDRNRAVQIVSSKFKVWHDNYQLNEYLHEVGEALQKVTCVASEMPMTLVHGSSLPVSREDPFISMDEIFTGPSSPLLCCEPAPLTDSLIMSTNVGERTQLLGSLLNCLQSLCSSTFERSYVDDLRASLLSFQSWNKEYRLLSKGDGLKKTLNDNLQHCENCVLKIYNALLSAVADDDTVAGDILSARKSRQGRLAVAAMIELRPRLCPTFFLQQLNRHRWPKLTEGWRRCIVQYALALTNVQQAKRLVDLSNHQEDLRKELCNRGHTNWDAMERPEILLLEVENGFLMREVQEDIARQMRDAVKNATLQLNMGEGKSSVIVPAVAVALADGSRLVRTITAKPQAKQTHQMLVSKLGGLADRRIYHMPFSRSIKLDEAGAIMIDALCRECMTNGGILLVQPEHVLSFKLMGLECLINGKEAVGRSLVHTQEFFDSSSQDIVDESDENFSVKFELIYTMGMQRPVELSPRRWVCIQQILDLVKIFAPIAAREDESSLEVDEGLPGSFPRTRILSDDGQRRLFTRIAEFICDVGLHGFPISRQPQSVREAVFQYLTEPSLSQYEIARVESQGPGGFWAETTSQTFLLLRGLLAGGVLAFTLRQKRWRVQYGLDLSRQPPTKLAVPYRAKDSPTLRAEFSHPDVVIVLTCLSHYYGGMGDNDLFLTFDHLLKSDQADSEYQEWVKDAPDLAPAFRQLSGINLKDSFQCTEQVFPSLRKAKNTIDYFLTHLVFPKEMREFPHKLSASGWDIGRIKTHATCGFSGTNDSRMTLPLNMTHLDLPAQKHTNALVLERLLRAENSLTLIPSQGKACRSTTENLLCTVTSMNPSPQVILDVGAQILELTNLQVARQWLERVQDHEHAQAVVFFDDDDELFVLDRKGRLEPLQSSPFIDQLDVCLVFLDEAHTRGTDLKLPAHYKAAVTLGPSLTKDRLIQACMRMRKLGHGQSVVFCVTEEIKRQILGRKKHPRDKAIDVADVLCWAITETWTDIRRSMPLWAVQGRRFEHQCELWDVACIGGELPMSKTQAEKFLEDESQSLEHRYRPNFMAQVATSMQASDNVNIRRIMERCLEFDVLEFNAATLQEEQERELSPEIVQQREVQKPAPADPAEHDLHTDLITFVKEGTILNSSNAFKPAFTIFRLTSAATHADVSQFPKDVLVTADFARTVQLSGKNSALDAYQRPVQWILTSIGNCGANDTTVKHLVIISPYEAQVLQTLLHHSKRVTLHLYAPRPNLGIRPLDKLDLYIFPGTATLPTLPSSFIIQLNLFAGQLHLGSFKEYVELCTLLGLASQKAEDGSTIAADGFIIRDSSGQRPSRFSKSPVAFLRVLMTKIRKNCEEVDKTHIGAMLDGRLLQPSDFARSAD